MVHVCLNVNIYFADKLNLLVWVQAFVADCCNSRCAKLWDVFRCMKSTQGNKITAGCREASKQKEH